MSLKQREGASSLGERQEQRRKLERVKQQKMDSLTDQRAKLDEQIKECAASIRTAEDRLEEARQAWIESEADPKPDKKAQTIELNYEEFMHIGKMLEHFVGLTSTAGTSEGGPVRRKLPGGSVGPTHPCSVRGQGHPRLLQWTPYLPGRREPAPPTQKTKPKQLPLHQCKAKRVPRHLSPQGCR